MLTVSADLRNLENNLNALPGLLKKSLALALNTTIEKTQAYMVERMAAATGIPAIIIEPSLKRIRAIETRLEAEVNAKTRGAAKAIPILQLQAKQVGRGPKVAGGVSFRFEGQTKTIPDAFIATMRSGHRGVFSRTGRRRLPIIEEKGPALRTVFDRASADGLAFAERELNDALEAELVKVAASV